MPYWNNKVALITGASAGLGRALAETFAAAGAKVVLAARGEDELKEVVNSIDSSGGEATYVAADITVQKSVDTLFKQAIDQFGQLDVLINNAGRSMRGNVTDTTADEFAALMDINFFSAVRCTLAAMPHLQSVGGHVVNIGSLASKGVGPHLGAYPASKFALAAYSAQLRWELKPLGVHVLLVCPGPIARDDGSRNYDEQAAELPESARKPGAGVRLRSVSATWLARRIMDACQRRDPELVIPWKARWLFAISQLSPRWGDTILRSRFR